ncbi:hypothetical protein [Candidatus Nitrosocosmicus sp. SS]|jgi:hypothetical protein|uniref:hypothetical protein n=1 Tax=Candidatus Nitrosocosmicus agrestis TaxID=2563600 RepID=UPI00122E5035|nr:hypothetical protein [Candidatus Nitrosocosmicus sp. SS]KAA2282413.1 hypothetical protein F1Z66_05860 [Candidatus Nitrosocosmicus sp. SS]KAF0867993.1 hypothetical protein E5N71_12485 [Candidatus Nitrosocosmicus sp. SS]
MNRYLLLVVSITLTIQFLILAGGISPLQNASGQSNSSAIATTSAADTTGTVTANYFARFNCGAINDDSGPLRPGKYDSDITIFNKKDFPVTVIWKAIAVDQQYNSNYHILTVPSEKIVNVNCEKIQPFSQLNNNSSNSSNNSSAGRFTEGVVKIEISIDNGILVNNFLNNQNSNEMISAAEIGNLVNVDVLHTVNTLDDLNKEVLYLKTDFSLPSDNGMGRNNFTAVFHISPDKIIDPISLIKTKLESTISNNNSTIKERVLDIRVTDSEVISDTLTDNHALTVQRVEPIIS